MRRRERAIEDSEEIAALLSSATVCRLGLWDGERPYVVPVNFGYEDGSVYFHSAPEGRKIDLLRQGRPVCVEVEADVELVPAQIACRSTTRYRSVIAIGRASFVEDRERKREALRLIVRQCGGEAAELPDAAVDAVAVVRVSLDEATGKRSPG